MGNSRRITSRDLVYMIFILALPFSWATSVFGSIYRAVSIVLILVFMMLNTGRVKIVPDNYIVRRAFLYYVLFTAMTMIWTANRSTGINEILGMLLILVIAYIFSSYVYDDEKRNIVDYCWIIAGVISAFIYMRGGVASVGIYGNRTTLMILGTATDPNEFSSIFVVSIPLMIAHVINNKKLIVKIGFVLLSLLEIYVVLVVGSRGALIGAVIAGLVTLFVEGKLSVRSFIISMIGALIILWVVIVYLLPAIPHDILARLSIRSMISDGGSGRTTIWASGMSQWINGNPFRWLFGYGVDGIKAHGIRGDTGTMHNQILQQIVYYGIIGLFLYIRLIWVSYKTILHENSRYLGAFLGIMFMSLTLTMGAHYKILWILLMMAFVKPKIVENQGEQ